MNVWLKVKNAYWGNRYIWYFLLFIFCFFLFGTLQSQPTFLDPDSFYHAKMAVLVKEQGIVQNFPWLSLTSLKDNYIDQHYLYHVLLVPFILFIDPLIGVKLFSVAFAALFVVVFYWFLRQVNKGVAPLINGIFSLIILVCQPLIFRLNLAKAPALSLIFLFFGFYLIIKHRYYLLAIFSFFYVYLYGGWPLILVVLFFYILGTAIEKAMNILKEKELDTRYWIFRNAFKKLISNIKYLISGVKIIIVGFFSRSNLKLMAATFGGLTAGLVINPYFPKSLTFYWQQFVQIGIVNYGHIIRVGSEWSSYGAIDLFLNTAPLTLLLLVSLVLFIISYKKQKGLSWSVLFLALFFFLATLKSQRYVEYYTPFAVLFGALSLGYFLTTQKVLEYWRFLKSFYVKRTIIATALIIYWIVALSAIISRDFLENWNFYQFQGKPFAQFQPAAIWMKNNIPAGQTIFHSDWDEFPQLFYHNSQNYYISGLDPTFLYLENKDLAKEFENITLGNTPLGDGSILRKDFGASYVFVEAAGHDKLIKNLDSAELIHLVYQDKEVKIFKIK